MKRFCPQARDEVYDLIVAGGGIHGASMAYTAALNDLKTVLLERVDFGAGTSANSQKVIHGGLRYLQSFDIKRVINSIREKQRFFFLFPHLVEPLPCVLPTSGWGTKGNEAFRLAFLLYRFIQLVSCRGKLARNTEKIPRLLSAEEVCQRFSNLRGKKIRGGALWYDGLCTEPERVILGLLKGAAKRGAGIANYAEIKEIHRIDKSTLCVTVCDHLQQQQYQLKSRKIALCTGPSFKDNLGPDPVPKEMADLTLIRGMNVILPSLFKSKTSFATKVYEEEESRFLFIVPWKKYSIAGTHWEECTDQTDPWVEQEQARNTFHRLIQKTISEENPLPAVLSKHVGVVPGKPRGKNQRNAAQQILPHFRLIDREVRKKSDVLQVVGVKFTTAFDVAIKSLKKLFPKVALKDSIEFAVLPCGSPADDPQLLLKKYQVRYDGLLTTDHVVRIFNLAGTDSPRIVEKYLRPLQKEKELLRDADLFSGLTVYSVTEEMTVHLDDLIFRRLFPDTPTLPSMKLLDTLAESMEELLLWSSEQKKRELAQVIEQREKRK